jgi:hypothetical protein
VSLTDVMHGEVVGGAACLAASAITLDNRCADGSPCVAAAGAHPMSLPVVFLPLVGGDGDTAGATDA